MNLNRELSIIVMRFTQAVNEPWDFLGRNGVQTPMPEIPGAIPQHARIFFPSLFLKGLAADLMVAWSIGDFPEDVACSSYYDPSSDWYNVFYGAYGVRSEKPDGTFWGYREDGSVNFEEMFEVPELDYNYLTAGQLGCPPEKQRFRVLEHKIERQGQWDVADVKTEIPSGLHKLANSVDANPLYYTIFGLPHREWSDGHESYELVQMVGKIFFRPLREVGLERITLAWGSMCPDTSEGNSLLNEIISSMQADYL